MNNNDVSDSVRLDLLFSHYNDTYSLHKQTLKRRNWAFLFLCIWEALGFIMLLSPARVIAFCLNGIDRYLGFSSGLVSSVVLTLIWMVSVYITIRYVQDSLHIERDYIYLDKLEKRIQELSGEDIFCREGDEYLRDYPIVLNLIDLFYKMVMPIVFNVMNILLIIQEWKRQEQVSISLICDTVLSVTLFIILWFYFFEIHPRISAQLKKNKAIKYMSEILHKALKGV